jgi:APA family basic amino acid/polyamine antiporter
VTPPRRQLGLWVTAAIVIANMIGTGIFTSTGFSAKSLHDPVTILIGWVAGGVIALCGAACYAELGTMMPKAGGEYVYLREAYHPALGFVSGWVSLTAGFSAPIASAALSFAAYVAVLTHGAIDQKLAAVLLIAAVTLMHSFDTKFGGRVQAVFTGLKVALIVVFITAGLASGNGDWSHFHSQNGGISNVFTTSFAISLMYVMFAYSGWNAAAYIAGEIKQPEKTLPRSLLIGTVAVMALYVLLNVVYFYAVPSDTLAGPADKFAPVVEVGSTSATALFGTRGGNLITSLIALALISAVSAMVMAAPRVYAAMAADRALPPQLGWYSKRGVPTVAVVLQGVLGILFVLVSDLGALMRFSSFLLALFAALTCGALFIMRRRGMVSAYRTPLYPLPPLVFIAISVWIAYAQFKMNPKELAVAVGVLVVGAALYAVLVKPAPRVPEARVVSDDSSG